MRKSVKLICVLPVVLLTVWLSGCVGAGAVLVTPDPCKDYTDAMIEVVELWSQLDCEGADCPAAMHIHLDYETHCCEDDALSGRDTSHCVDLE